MLAAKVMGRFHNGICPSDLRCSVFIVNCLIPIYYGELSLLPSFLKSKTAILLK